MIAAGGRSAAGLGKCMLWTMSTQTRPAPPAPGEAFKKDNGKWTFYVYPRGIPREAGDWDDEESAKTESANMLQLWENNGRSYGRAGMVHFGSV